MIGVQKEKENWIEIVLRFIFIFYVKLKENLVFEISNMLPATCCKHSYIF